VNATETVSTAPRATLPPPTGPPAGWYRDATGYAVMRYFDGRCWTGHTAPIFSPPGPAHATMPLAAATGAVAVLMVSLLASRLLLDGLLRFEWPVAAYAAIAVMVGYGPSVWWCWFATGRWGTGSRSDDLGLRWRWSDLGWGPVVWLATVACELVVVVVIEVLDVPLSSNTEGIGDVDLDRTYVLTLLITAVIAAPVVEEIVFRGLVLRGLLSRMSAVLAVGVQGLLFGLPHIDPVFGAGNIGLVLVLAAVGVALGGAAYLLRRIGPTIIAHAIFNAVVMTVVLLR
jgi:uncharacterized protein